MENPAGVIDILIFASLPLVAPGVIYGELLRSYYIQSNCKKNSCCHKGYLQVAPTELFYSAKLQKTVGIPEVATLAIFLPPFVLILMIALPLYNSTFRDPDEVP